MCNNFKKIILKGREYYFIKKFFSDRLDIFN